jgi:metal-responsive CopG/Arc/MetJ family transcriptional regulator
MAKRLIGAQLDQQLIDEIDETAKRLGVNRSTFIRRALDAYLADNKPSA